MRLSVHPAGPLRMAKPYLCVLQHSLELPMATQTASLNHCFNIG